MDVDNSLIEDAQVGLNEELPESATNVTDLHLKQKIFVDITSKLLPELRDCLASKVSKKMYPFMNIKGCLWL